MSKESSVSPIEATLTPVTEEAAKNLFKPRVRNEHGLIDGLEYVFNPDGTINWRAMVKPEYLVINSAKTSETDISKVPDSNLLILLGGLKELAQVRGYRSVRYSVAHASSDYFATCCRIEWRGNYETQNEEVVFEAIADASLNNTEGFTQNYLAAIAENRAFVRCIRNFLKINITSKEELKSVKPNEDGAGDSAANGSDPVSTLADLMKRANLSFEKIKKRLTKDGDEKAESYKQLSDIPSPRIFELIDKVNTHLESKKSK